MSLYGFNKNIQYHPFTSEQISLDKAKEEESKTEEVDVQIDQDKGKFHGKEVWKIIHKNDNIEIIHLKLSLGEKINCYLIKKLFNKENISVKKYFGQIVFLTEKLKRKRMLLNIINY